MYGIDGRKYRGRHSIVEKSDARPGKKVQKSINHRFDTKVVFKHDEVLKKLTIEIIAEARNEEQQEDRDKKTRETNIIIHGIPNKKFTNQAEEEKWNKEFSNKLISDLKITVKKKITLRLGTFKEDKHCPIKVVFTTVKDKESVMSNLKNLKGVEGYGKMSITDDHTKAERELIKSWAIKAKERNAEEPDESNIIWRMRGSPESGIYLKKFVIKRQASQ